MSNHQSDTPETDVATHLMAESLHHYRAVVDAEVCEKMERERDETRKKLSYKTQTWTMAEGTIREQFQRIARLEVEVSDLKRSAEANGAIWDKSRERTLNITRKCCDAMAVLRRGGENQTMLDELREILLPKVESDCVAAESADEKPDGQAENADVRDRPA